MVIFIRKNGRNMISLLLIVLALYLLDNTKLKKYIGYHKVKEYIKEDMDIFSTAKGLFGKEILSFYNLDSSVSTPIISKEKYLNGYLVYQYDNHLYSEFVGSVIEIDYTNNVYSIVISGLSGNVLISNIKDLNVKLYQKIEAGTLVGMIDQYYYYEEI